MASQEASGRLLKQPFILEDYSLYVAFQKASNVTVISFRLFRGGEKYLKA